jgi:hypothetical protein
MKDGLKISVSQEHFMNVNPKQRDIWDVHESDEQLFTFCSYIWKKKKI